MSKNSMKENGLAEHPAGIGAVTRKRVHERAVELAAIDGRSVHEATRADWDQARLELTDDLETSSSEAVLDDVPESGSPVPGSTGAKVPVPPGEEEDDEGRGGAERLVAKGVAGAAHDRRMEAAKAAFADNKDIL